MQIGNNIIIEKIENGNKLTILNFPKNINITASDFIKALAQRTMEGFSPNSEEEIDIIQGIDKEKTTGENIIVLYTLGDINSCIILAGVLYKKLLNYNINVMPLEIGGISAGEKNEAYIRVAIQKMIITKDSLGSSLEFILPKNINFLQFKKDFSYILLELIPETTALEFNLGKASSKKSLSNIGYELNKVQVTFAPHIEGKIPALALVHCILIESIVNIILN